MSDRLCRFHGGGGFRHGEAVQLRLAIDEKISMRDHAFAFGDGERYVAQRLGAVGVAVAEMFDVQRVHVFHPLAHMAS